MSRPGRPPRSQQRLLTPEDEALWSSVARSLKPFRKKARVHPSAAHPESLPASEPIGPNLADEQQRAAVEASRPGEGEHQTSRPKSPAKPPPLAEFDRRKLRHIAGGRLEIEARLDLHGMRAGEAHSALKSFIFAACAKGQRNVLVITGKGSGAGLSDRPFDLDQPDRGVLKRSVPMWLAEPELRSVVVSFTQAHPRHGGEGALYLQLRSRRRQADRSK